MDAAAYARQLKQLLPRGSLFRLEPESWLSKLLLAIADELARIDKRGDDLVDEWDPSTALETLDDWERVLGITPPANATASERQVAIVAKLNARGGQTAAYYVELAARLGFVATVVETAPHTWRMDVDLSQSTGGAATFTEFRADESRAEDRVESRDVAVLEAAINEAKPAHTVVLFAYST